MDLHQQRIEIWSQDGVKASIVREYVEK